MMRTIFLLLSASFLHGCCCCGMGGGGTSSGGGGRGPVSDKIGEWATEKAVEAIAEGISGEDVDIDAEKGRITITTDDGSMTTYSNGQVPPGFPFPVMPGARVVSSSLIQPNDQPSPILSLMLQTSAPPEEVAKYYRSQAESAGYAVVSISAEMENMAEATKEMEEVRGKGIQIPLEFEPPADGTGEMLRLEKEGGGGAVWVGADAGTTSAWVLVGTDL